MFRCYSGKQIYNNQQLSNKNMSIAAISAKGAWSLDASHSEIGFKVKHLVVSTVTGKFDQFEGTVEALNDDFSDAKVSFSTAVNSINTGNEQRDGHLKSDDFFNVEQFPRLSFRSTAITKVNADEYRITGDLTIRDVTRSIELKAEFGGSVMDPWGGTRTGFELHGKINRKDFNLKWNVLTEAGGAVVSDEVKLHINAELVKQA
jgi:polyisoprenoid-binding protein YceI